MKNRKYLLYLFLILIAGFSSCDFNDSGKLINGVKSPNITLPDRDNNDIELFSFKGKIVLVDFWASWCKPCRKVNPKIVAIYKKYEKATFDKATGFEIYSISLDSDKEKWLKAIKEDGLIWPAHVSELKGWNSGAVEKFNINFVPASFLLDQDGIIIGKDLRYQDLDRILAERLAK